MIDTADTRNDFSYKGYRLLSDLHTHTVWSHGVGSIEDNVIAAIKRGLKEIGISDHAPGHFVYGFRNSEILKMRKEIDRLKTMYPMIKILLGAEANIVDSSGEIDIDSSKIENFDYVLAGYHFGALGAYPIKALFFAGVNGARNGLRKIREISNKFYANHLKECENEKKHHKNLGSQRDKIGFRLGRSIRNVNTSYIVKTLYENDIYALTHPGDKAEVDILEVAKACAATNTLMEINSHHMSLSIDDMKLIKEIDVNFLISSDAHAPNRVGEFFNAIDLLIEADVDMKRVVNIEKVM